MTVISSPSDATATIRIIGLDENYDIISEDVLNIQRRFPFKYDEKSDIQFQLRASGGTQFMSTFGEGALVRE